MTYFCMYSRPALAGHNCSSTYDRESRERRSWSGHRWRHGGRSSGYAMTRHGGSGGGNFGVRRPLRYLRYHLDLDDSQSRGMAAVLNRLKLEREQARLNEQRGVQTVADLLASDTLDQEALIAALQPRVATAEQLRKEVAAALREIYDILDADQRVRFADLVASGTFSL